MKGKLISILKILGIGFTEVVIDIDLSDITINTIEIKSDNIILHAFKNNIDVEIPFDDIDIQDQMIIYETLKTLLYN
jgi:hypothetical protein